MVCNTNPDADKYHQVCMYKTQGQGTSDTGRLYNYSEDLRYNVRASGGGVVRFEIRMISQGSQPGTTPLGAAGTGDNWVSYDQVVVTKDGGNVHENAENQ